MSYEIIRKRWPRIAEVVECADNQQLNYEILEQGNVTGLRINGILISSLYEPHREALLQASSVAESSIVAYVYGLGTGELPRVLLRRPKIEKLFLVIFNPQVVRILLDNFSLNDILVDERVELLLAKDCDQVQKPFSAIPSCLSLASEGSRQIADKVFFELASQYNAIRHQNGDTWIAQQLSENIPLLESDHKVSELYFDKIADAIVVGAGPSLQYSISWMQENKNKLIIAVDSALKPLMNAGIVPDIVVAIDPAGDYVGTHLGIDSSIGKYIKLVYFPVVRNDVLTAWPGLRYMAVPDHPLYYELVSRYPRDVLYASGSVIHPAIDLSVHLGAKTVYMVGVDFAYSGEATHAEGSSFKRDLDFDKQVPGVFTTVENGEGLPVKTQVSFLGYLSDLEDYIVKATDITFVNMSRQGARIKGTIYPDEL